MTQDSRDAAKRPRTGAPLAGRQMAGVGFDLAVGMAVFAFGGYWLDRRRGTGQFWTLVGAGLGLVYIAYQVWKLVRSADGAEARKSSPDTTHRVEVGETENEDAGNDAKP
jgi:ATP synthase protein I